FFQAEDGIRDRTVTGVQTCALPISVTDQLRYFDFERIWNSKTQSARRGFADCINNNLRRVTENRWTPTADVIDVFLSIDVPNLRSEERRVGKEWKSRMWPEW